MEILPKNLKIQIQRLQLVWSVNMLELKDSYKSISESFIHAGVSNDTKVKVKWIHSEKLNDSNVSDELGKLNGILVAPDLVQEEFLGKISAVKFARENKIPFFGICLGMQCAVIEFKETSLIIKMRIQQK